MKLIAVLSHNNKTHLKTQMNGPSNREIYMTLGNQLSSAKLYSCPLKSDTSDQLWTGTVLGAGHLKKMMNGAYMVF
jgi:hypothetical protein